MGRIQHKRMTHFSLKKQYRGYISGAIILFYLLFLLTTGGESKVLLPQEHAPIYIFSNQNDDDLRLTLKKAIEVAQSRICVAAYSITDATIISSLRRKSEEGVTVTVYTDKLASPVDLSHRLGNKIHVIRKEGRGLMHHKILAIDQTSLWLGSTNLTRDSLTKHGNILVGIYSKELAIFAEKKIEELICKKKLSPPSAILPCIPLDDSNSTYVGTKNSPQQITLSFLPYDTKALETLISMIHTAQKTIRVAMYTFTHHRLIEALISAHHRGVQVAVVFDRDSSKKTSKYAFSQLQKEGVPIYVNQRPGLLHYKMMILDSHVLVAGSSNWTQAAFTINDDNVLVIDSLNSSQKIKLDTLWKKIIKNSFIVK